MAAKKKSTKKVAVELKSSDAFDLVEQEDYDKDVPEKAKLDIFEVLAAIDRKDRDYYDRLDDRVKKSIPFLVLLRWLSDVQGSTDLQHWYLAGSNAYANVDLFNLPTDDQGVRHDKLTWLCLTAASPGIGKQRHGWVGLKKLNDDPRLSFFRKQFPSAKESEIELLAKLNTDDQIKDYLRRSGEVS